MLVPFLVALIVSMGASLVLTPVVRWGATWVGAVDRPGGRRVHLSPVPRLGGLAIFAGYFIGEAAAWLTVRAGWFGVEHKAVLYPGHASLRRIFLVSVAVVLLGVWDDIRGASGVRKLLVQMVIALLAVSLGFRIDLLTSPTGGAIPTGIFSGPLTVIWMLALLNSMNLIDGIDGLAAGLAIIASLALFSIAVLRGNVEIALLLVGLVGACLGFVRHNLHPASIFMGDTGSLFLGSTLALITILASFKSAAAIALSFPLVVLAIPLAEASLTTVRRALRGQPILQADRSHIHHRLLEWGLSMPQAVTVIYAVAGAMGLAAVAVAGLTWGLVLPAVAALLVAGTLGLRVLLRLAPPRPDAEPGAGAKPARRRLGGDGSEGSP